MKLTGQNILITGGASGIGRLIGRLAIERGAKSIIIWDINPQSIEKVAAEHKELAAGKTQIEGFRVDVSDYDVVMDAYKQTVAAVGQVDVLVNCAGIVTSNKPFSQNTPSEIDRTIKVNTIAPMYVALAAINDMIARDHGHICTIASAAGMLSNPNMSIYAASKWGAIGWSDSVRIELQKAKSHVHITTVAPYYINTGIPFSFHFIRFFQGLLPTFFFDWFFGEVFGVYHTMDHFTGRKN